ncbi:hypothetical protein BaRGS_00032026, partial [Batillaria attramentaria]
SDELHDLSQVSPARGHSDRNRHSYQMKVVHNGAGVESAMAQKSIIYRLNVNYAKGLSVPNKSSNQHGTPKTRNCFDG